MKKFYVLLAVAVMVCMSSMVFAADVSVGGSVQIRSRDFNNLTFDKNSKGAGNQVDTQERIMLDVNAKAGDVKGKISLWNDFEDWGRFESNQGNGFGSGVGTDVISGGTTTPGIKGSGHFGFREAWLNFDLPGIPVNVTGGHQLLQLGNGWFFRSKHFGSDAWVVSNVTGNNTAGFVDVKIGEGLSGRNDDDIDAYAFLDVFKINEDMSVGVDLTILKDRKNGLTYGASASDVALYAGGDTNMQNLGINFNGKLGPVKLAAEVDIQSGKAKAADGLLVPVSDAKFKGNQIVIQGNVPMDPVTINFTVARGSGKKSDDTSPDVKWYVNFMDIDPHYTFLYEYKTITACGAKNTGFCNTTAVSAGAMFAATKSLNVGLDIWYLQATEKIQSRFDDSTSSALGTEIDAKIQWKLYDNLSWNWDIGYFKPGDALKKLTATATTAGPPVTLGHDGTNDAVTGIQGILALKF